MAKPMAKRARLPRAIFHMVFIFCPQVCPLMAARWKLQASHPHPVIFKGRKEIGFTLSLSFESAEIPPRSPHVNFSSSLIGQITPSVHAA